MLDRLLVRRRGPGSGCSAAAPRARPRSSSRRCCCVWQTIGSTLSALVEERAEARPDPAAAVVRVVVVAVVQRGDLARRRSSRPSSTGSFRPRCSENSTGRGQVGDLLVHPRGDDPPTSRPRFPSASTPRCSCLLARPGVGGQERPARGVEVAVAEGVARSPRAESASRKGSRPRQLLRPRRRRRLPPAPRTRPTRAGRRAGCIQAAVGEEVADLDPRVEAPALLELRRHRGASCGVKPVVRSSTRSQSRGVEAGPLLHRPLQPAAAREQLGEQQAGGLVGAQGRPGSVTGSLTVHGQRFSRAPSGWPAGRPGCRPADSGRAPVPAAQVQHRRRGDDDQHADDRGPGEQRLPGGGSPERRADEGPDDGGGVREEARRCGAGRRPRWRWRRRGRRSCPTTPTVPATGAPLKASAVVRLSQSADRAPAGVEAEGRPDERRGRARDQPTGSPRARRTATRSPATRATPMTRNTARVAHTGSTTEATSQTVKPAKTTSSARVRASTTGTAAVVRPAAEPRQPERQAEAHELDQPPDGERVALRGDRGLAGAVGLHDRAVGEARSPARR